MPDARGGLSRSTGSLFLVSILILGVIIITSVWLAFQTNTTSTTLNQARQRVGAARTILIVLQDLETGQRGFILTGDRDYLAPYERALERLGPTRDMLKALLAADQNEIARLNALDAAIDAKLAELSQTVTLVSSGDTAQAVGVVRSDRGKEAMDQARTILDDIISRGNTDLANLTQALQTNATAVTWVTGLGALAVVFIAAAAYWLIARFTRREIQARAEVEALNAGLEERVAERTLAVTRANDEIQRFAYIVSHDLRAPLVNIVGFAAELETSLAEMKQFVDGLPLSAADEARLVQARQCIDEDMPEALSFISASTSKMDKLINAILRLSREGRRELKAERVDLNDLVARTLAAVKHQMDASDTTADVQPGLPTLSSDRLALEQVFGNIIDNALKYLKPGTPGRIEISATRPSLREVIIEIADNGRGIAPQDHERIFELFRRAGRQDKAGEGIGLAHVRALVRRLGGDIGVRSAVGEGSRFLIRLPLVLSIDNTKTTTP